MKSQKSSHSRKACPRPDRGAAVHKYLKELDSRFRGNDKKGGNSTFYETIKVSRETIARK